MHKGNNKSFDCGAEPYAVNIEKASMQNQNYRTALWTGNHLQLTLMSIPVGGDIGLEVHPNTDQFIRVEQGKALVKMGPCQKQLNFSQMMYKGDAVFIPAGAWHNVMNVETRPLKVSVIYAPSHHPKGTVHRTKQDAQMEEW